MKVIYGSHYFFFNFQNKNKFKEHKKLKTELSNNKLKKEKKLIKD